MAGNEKIQIRSLPIFSLHQCHVDNGIKDYVLCTSCHIIVATFRPVSLDPTWPSAQHTGDAAKNNSIDVRCPKLPNYWKGDYLDRGIEQTIFNSCTTRGEPPEHRPATAQ